MNQGTLKGMTLKVPGEIRPTAAKVRAALTNSWQIRLPGAMVLDLFAGSGSVGLEALARGAGHAVFVEAASSVIPILKGNCALLTDEQTRVVRAQLPLSEGDLHKIFPDQNRFDLVFADPPYLFSEYGALLENIEYLLAKDGEIAIEHSADRNMPQPKSTERIQVSRSRKYGDSQLTIMAMRQSGILAGNSELVRMIGDV
jgi:16S rRNA (guanine966-N2)-methyltransferase